MKPNVLLITADQWRGDCLGAVGHPLAKTPNLDRLAADGVLFRRHYANAAPCSPARAVLYTGLYQMTNRVCRNGTPLDDRFDTIAKLARRAGFDPTLFGYTDTTPDPRTRAPADPALTTYEGVLPGFSVGQLLPENDGPWLSWLKRLGVDVSDPSSVHRPVDTAAPEVSNAAPVYDADQTQTAFLTDAFLDWLGERDSDTPWFAHVSYLRPHPPFIVPEPYASMVDPEAVSNGPRAATVEQDAAAHPLVSFMFERLAKSAFVPGADGLVADWGDRERSVLGAIYLGMIAEVDAQIGRLISGLKAAGAWDDTQVIFTSDHAEMMGDHRLFGKGGFYEGAYHIPLIVRHPGGAAGRVVDAFTEAVDILPTIADVLATAPITRPNGRSLRVFLEEGRPANWRDYVFLEFDFRDVAGKAAELEFALPSPLCNLAAIRDTAYKYVHFAGLPPLLFDLQADPGELNNLAADPSHRDALLAYADKLLRHRAIHLDQTLALTTVTPTGLLTEEPNWM